MGAKEATGPCPAGPDAPGPCPNGGRRWGSEPGVVAMQRLTAEEQVVLWPDKPWPQEIGALAALGGSGLLDPDGRLRIEAVRRRSQPACTWCPGSGNSCTCHSRGWAGRCGSMPPCSISPGHVQVASLPAPGDEAAQLLATKQLRRRR
jgi:diacylglycerol O-acyltransferase